MDWLLSYVGTAALWAAIASLVILAVAWFVGRPLGRGTGSTLALTLFFLILTQHPFPDPGSLICPVPRTDPNLRPFAFVVNEPPNRNSERISRDSNFIPGFKSEVQQII